MITDEKLHELMGYAADEDREQLAAMIDSMDENDIWYFKGYVTGYAEAVSHLQIAAVEDDELQGLKCPED